MARASGGANARKRGRPRSNRPVRKKPCPGCGTLICGSKPVPSVDYKDIASLRKFVSDRGKIRSRRVTGACAQYQRKVAIAVKNAREMALLPYLGHK